MAITSNPNRMVAALTPVVFAPLAGAISVLAAKYFPGVDIPSGSVEAIFIAGATIAFAKAGLWLKGWQEYEKRTVDVDVDAGGEIDLGEEPDLDDEPELDDAPDMDGEPELDGEHDLDDEPELGDEPDFDEEPTPDGEPVAAGQEA